MNNIFAVLVLYKCNLQESCTFNSLKRALKNTGYKLNLLIYDNSPTEQENNSELSPENINITYKHDPSNSGLVYAYNHAIDLAFKNNKPWLLLLDQDTKVSEEYLSELETLTANEDAEYVSIVPSIFDNNVLISPSRETFFLGQKPIDYSEAGNCMRNITAINSASCLKASFLNTVGGFSNDFPLDFLDHWFYREVLKRNESLYVSKIKLQHKLSVMDYNSLSKERLINILKSESKFYRTYRFRLIIRLVLRYFKLLKNKHFSHAKLVFENILNLLLKG